MTAFTNYAEDLIMNWLFRNTGSAPTAWWAALHSADPTETGSTAELSGNGYARQSCTFNAASSGLVDNVADITFGPNTSSNWGTVSHTSVWTLVTGGNCLIKGALSSSVTINVNDSLKIAAGALDLSVD
jgi:hypothetical protein